MNSNPTPPQNRTFASENTEEEWITLTAAAHLVDVPYNDMVSAVHHYKILESRKEHTARLVRRSEVMEKADQLKNLPIKRRPNRRLRGRRPGATR